MTRTRTRPLAGLLALVVAALLLVASAGAGTTAWLKDPAPNLAPTAAWEANAVQEPNVWQLPDGSCRAWYSGGWANEAIGTAAAEDCRTWTKDAANPVVGLGRGGIAGPVGRPFVMPDPAGGWRMYFTDNGNASQLRVTTSTDGVTWAPQHVVLSPAGWEQSLANTAVVVQGGTWHMVYEALVVGGGYWAMGYATSTDGETWTRRAGPLTSLSVGGSYGGPYLRRGATDWELWYHASPAGFTPTRIYHAHSADLVTWTRDPQPELDLTLPWEVDQVADPWVASIDGADVMFYAGMDNAAEAGRIGRAPAATPPATTTTTASTSTTVAEPTTLPPVTTTTTVKCRGNGRRACRLAATP